MAMIELHGRDVSLVLEAAAKGAPLWRHWGPRLADGAIGLAPLAEGRPPASFSLDEDVALSVFPGFGLGWFGRPALSAHRDGRDFAHAFDLAATERPGPGRLTLRLRDAVAGLEVGIDFALDADDVLTVRSRLTNTGDTPLDLLAMAAAVLPLPGEADRLRVFAGRHLDEFRAIEALLGRTGFLRETRRGLTSHDAPPLGFALTPGAGDHAGLAYAAALAWSGNHVQAVDWVEDGRFQWSFGEAFAPGEMRLRPGETYAAPDVVAVCSLEGLNGIGRRLHAATRTRLTWPGEKMRPRPVSLNTWEAVYFDHDLEGLKALADAAAQAGVERFVLDDGWFRGRDDDRAGLGDWTPDAAKYPHGLGPLVEHVTGLGLQFGLWVEPEMANPDSDLLRRHPDWALAIDGRARPTARNQLVLDLSRDEVVDYLFEALDALLAAHPIAYLKWDHNRDLAPAATAQGRAAYHAQVEGLYRLLGRVRAAHPDVEIESCAGGGGRIDLGVLGFTHRVWTSDNIDARSRTAIQRGFLRAFPPEIMGAHVGAAVAHTTGRTQSLDFRAATALPGHFGVELDLRRASAPERARLKTWIALYKALRARLHGPPVTLGEGQDGVLWQAHGPDADGGFVLFLSRLEPPSFRHAPPVALPIAAAGVAYRIERLDPPPAGADAHRAFAPWTRPIDGTVLAKIGLPMPPLAAESCIVLALTPETGSP